MTMVVVTHDGFAVRPPTASSSWPTELSSRPLEFFTKPKSDRAKDFLSKISPTSHQPRAQA